MVFKRNGGQKVALTSCWNS